MLGNYLHIRSFKQQFIPFLSMVTYFVMAICRTKMQPYFPILFLQLTLSFLGCLLFHKCIHISMYICLKNIHVILRDVLFVVITTGILSDEKKTEGKEKVLGRMNVFCKLEHLLLGLSKKKTLYYS